MCEQMVAGGGGGGQICDVEWANGNGSSNWWDNMLDLCNDWMSN